ncbi:MAG TPA: PAS domain S-box protein [Thermotogota bacterium]|nr:PAS domain S-box protein [Thermotogota bacterium]
MEDNSFCLLVTDLNGRVKYANSKACQRMGFFEGANESLLQERLISTLLPDDYFFGSLEEFARTKGWERKIRKVHRDGTIRWESITVVPVFDAQDEFAYAVVLIEDISDQKGMADALAVSEKRFREVAEHSHTVVWETDTEGLFTYVSPVCERVWGYRPEEMVHKMHFYDLFPPDEREEAKNEGLSLMREEKALTNFENRSMHKDGRLIWLSSNAVPVYDSEGLYIGYRGTENEITERKTLEEETHRFRATTDQANYGTAIAQMDGTLNYVNHALVKMLGTDEHALLGKNLFASHIKERSERIAALEEKIRIQGGFSSEEVQFVRTDGTSFPALMSVKVVVDARRRPLFQSLTLMDISKLKEYEKLLTLLSHAVEQNPAYVIITDTSGHIEYVNPAFTEKIGYALEDVKGSRAYILRPEHHSPTQYRELWETLESGGTWRGEFRNKRKNGEVFWEYSTISPVVDQKGEATHYVVVNTDITEQKVALNAYKESETILQAFTRTSREAIFMIDSEDTVCFWNPSAYEIFGYREEEVLGEKLDSFIRPYVSSVSETPSFLALLKDNQKAPGAALLDLEVYTKSGALVSVEFSQSITFLGENRYRVVVGRDVRERKQAEADRIAREAAEASNRAKSAFLSNMSHEIRTPLNAILGFAQILNRDASLSSKQIDHVQTILRSGEHLLKLINNVLELSKIEAGKLTLSAAPFDLHNCILDLERVFRFKAEEKGLQLLVERAPDLPHYILSDEGKFRQILINLLGNAVKFTQTGGIALRARTVPDPTRTVAKPESLLLQVEVEDSGIGISENALSRIFEAFNTSLENSSASGTGLGLAISKRLIELMGGTLSVKSKVGTGSQFRFEIPITPAEGSFYKSATPTAEIKALHPSSKPVRVLIVDDLTDNRTLLRALLEPIGFETEDAVDGKEAIELFKRWSPHAILMDLRMPVMDGYEATRLIKGTEKGSKTAVIAVTASAFDEDEKAVLATGADGYIRKPFRPDELLSELGRLLPIVYLYESPEEETPKKTAGVARLTKEDLAILPEPLRQRLFRYVEEGEMTELKNTLAKVEALNPEVSQALLALAKQYDYERLTDLLKDT